MKTGVELITEERQRQIEKEGWSEHHDAGHNSSELSMAAIAYIKNTIYPRVIKEDEILKDWPWAVGWWRPKTKIRDLVRAGALIAAEIDRLQREAERA